MKAGTGPKVISHCGHEAGWLAFAPMVASSRTERVLYWVAAATIAAGLVVGSLALASAWPPTAVAFAFTGFQVPLAIAFGGMGLLLIRRRPCNRIGLLLVPQAIVSTTHFPFHQLAIAVLPPGSPALAPVVA